MMSHTNFPGKRPILTSLYIVAFLALASFSIWDIYKITDDYINDNRIISVTRVNITDKFPFLGDTKVCLVYKGDLIFPTNFSNSSLYLELFSSFWRQENVTWPQFMTDFDKSIASALFRLSLPFVLISQLDKEGTIDLHKQAATINIDPSIWKSATDQATWRSIIDQHLSDPKSIDSIKTAWRYVQPVFVHADDAEKWDITPHSTLFDRFCFEIPLYDHFTADLHRMSYFLDSTELENVMVPNSSEQLRHPRVTPSMYIGFSTGDDIDTMHSETNMRTYTRIVISNIGIYDSTKFPPCTSKYQSRETCLEDRKLKIVQDICNCTQYTPFLTRALRTRRNTSEYGDMKFCTTKSYEKCWAEAQAAADKDRITAIDTGECTPCKLSKNTYMVSTYARPLDNTHSLDTNLYPTTGPMSPREALFFECQDRTYLHFEEKPQFGFSQYVSQIGGDLGLYIGFSMVTVLNMMVFSWNACRQQNGDGSQDIGPGRAGFASYLAICAQKIEGIFDRGSEFKGHGNCAERIKDLEARLEDMQKQMDQVRSAYN